MKTLLIVGVIIGIIGSWVGLFEDDGKKVIIFTALAILCLAGLN